MAFLYSVCFGLLWLSPSIIAFLRAHKNLMPIIILNFFLSFTIIGYAIALIWSFSENIGERKLKIKDWQILTCYFLFFALNTFVMSHSVKYYEVKREDFVKIYQFIIS